MAKNDWKSKSNKKKDKPWKGKGKDKHIPEEE